MTDYVKISTGSVRAHAPRAETGLHRAHETEVFDHIQDHGEHG